MENEEKNACGGDEAVRTTTSEDVDLGKVDNETNQEASLASASTSPLILLGNEQTALRGTSSNDEGNPQHEQKLEDLSSSKVNIIKVHRNSTESDNAKTEDGSFGRRGPDKNVDRVQYARAFSPQSTPMHEQDFCPFQLKYSKDEPLRAQSRPRAIPFNKRFARCIILSDHPPGGASGASGTSGDDDDDLGYAPDSDNSSDSDQNEYDEASEDDDEVSEDDEDDDSNSTFWNLPKDGQGIVDHHHKLNEPSPKASLKTRKEKQESTENTNRDVKGRTGTSREADLIRQLFGDFRLHECLDDGEEQPPRIQRQNRLGVWEVEETIEQLAYNSIHERVYPMPDDRRAAMDECGSASRFTERLLGVNQRWKKTVARDESDELPFGVFRRCNAIQIMEEEDEPRERQYLDSSSPSPSILTRLKKAFIRCFVCGAASFSTH